ncbi:MAG: ferrochelatase, partial [Bacteroidota bacterium]
MTEKTAVILINTGTPASPSTGDVKRYLREFLTDARVITLPALPRKALVHGIIAPFRAPKSAGLYRKVWTEKGSPLLWHTQSMAKKLQTVLGSGYDVITGMRYGKPSLTDALEMVEKENYREVVLLPLFPQYASSTTGSALELAMKLFAKQNSLPAIRMVGQFYDNPGFIRSFAKKMKEHSLADYDHILFSYHSLPLSHLRACHQGRDCTHFNCMDEINQHNAFCYHATCMATTRLLAKEAGLSPG